MISYVFFTSTLPLKGEGNQEGTGIKEGGGLNVNVSKTKMVAFKMAGANR
jgi:hypothetical protein